MSSDGLKALRSDLGEYEIRLRKKYGQNFCHDKTVIEKIVTGCSLDRSDWILEIGAGTGCLTTSIAEIVHSVIAVEIDTNLRPLLLRNTEELKNVRVIFDDILQLDMRSMNPTKVIGNLPYYCASAIIRQWSNQVPSSNAYFMLPDDIVNHLKAKPKTREYTAFSVFAQYAFNTEVLFKVHANSFFPKPNVGSAFVKLTPPAIPRLPIVAEEHFIKVVEGAFMLRRKMLVNSLTEAGFTTQDVYSAMSFLGLDKNIRGEELTVEQFKRLAGFIPV